MCYINRSCIEPVHQLQLTRTAQGNEAAYQKETYGYHEVIHRQLIQQSTIRQLDH